MNKKTGNTLSLTMILGLSLGLILANSSMAHADNKSNRGHSQNGHYERSSNERGRDYHHKKFDNKYNHHGDRYQKRVVYYNGYSRPSYQVVYYRPWEAAPVVSRYRVGDYLPRYVHLYEPPRNVVAVLPPVHRGTRYVQVDQNVYLVSEASKQILDAVVLLSGVR